MLFIDGELGSDPTHATDYSYNYQIPIYMLLPIALPTINCWLTARPTGPITPEGLRHLRKPSDSIVNESAPVQKSHNYHNYVGCLPFIMSGLFVI